MLLKVEELHAGGGRLGRTPQELQRKAVPLQVPPSTAVAVNDTYKGDGLCVRWGSLVNAAQATKDKLAACLPTGCFRPRLPSCAAAARPRTWNVVSTTLPATVLRLHWGSTVKFPPPSRKALGRHVQLSFVVGRQRPEGRSASSQRVISAVSSRSC